MDAQDTRLDYLTLSKQGTGSLDIDDDTVSVVYPLDRYEITVKLTRDGRFLGIEEVRVNKHFLDHLQQLRAVRPSGSQALDDYYRLEEE